MRPSLGRWHLLAAGALLASVLALSCGEEDTSEQETPTTTIAAAPDSSPTAATGAVAPYMSFADEMAAALEREDVAWFVQQLGDGGTSIQVVQWREDRLIAGSQDFEAFMNTAFRSVDEEAEDEYGAGPLRLYAVGEQTLRGDVRVVHLLLTGIMEAPQPGRWALVLKTGEELQVHEVLELPPAAAEQLLAFRPLPQPEPDPATYPGGFATLVDELRQALSARDGGAIVARLLTWPLTCDEQTALYTPFCRSQPAGTVMDIVNWGWRCVQCSPGGDGYATPDEIKAWLDRFFASTQTSAADDLGPAALQLESISLELSGYSINVTGVGDPAILDYPRPPGRWVFTFHTLAEGDEWRIVELQVADPDNSRWVLETWRGTGIITWTRWPPSD
ncbi:MAG: hypothetical protein A2148_05645 [Chloroflexi bacterium RBG_16_68_14]|nr:MAG: hypothetical protein A2148_05645 [Chloroflexi bacterium RBG_16_68_14]